MAVVNFDSFAQGTTIQSTDQVVGFADTHAGGERKWPLSTIVNAVTNSVTNSISQSLSSSGGTFSIRRLADSLMNQNYVGAAITTNEEAIIWGNMDVYQIGHYLSSSNLTPREAISIPFIDGADNSKIDNRVRIVNVKKEGKTIAKFHHTWLQSMALLSDGTVWVKAYIDSSTYCMGWSNAETAGCVVRYASAFYRVTQWDWTNPALANKIIDIQVLPVNGTDTEGTFCALDNQGDLHFWGYMNPQYGTAVRYRTPQNTTKGIVKLQGNVSDFQITGENGVRMVTVLTKNNEIWSFGYNGYGELGDNTVTARTGWVQAQYATTPTGTTKVPVANAMMLVRQRNWNYLNLGYVSTGAVQNTLYVSGWGHDGQSVKAAAPTAANVYTGATGGTSPINDPIIEAVNQSRSNRSTMLYRTASGRVYSAGMNDYGEGGRMNGAATALGPTFAEVSVLHPITGVKTVFGPSSGITAVSITTDNGTGACTTAIIATISTAGYTGIKYLFLSGYYSLANTDDYSANSFIFTPVKITESVDEVLLGADRTNHRYTYIKCSTGRVYGLGYSASGNLKQTDGWVPLPMPIF